MTETTQPAVHDADKHRYDPASIEPKWQQAWADKAIYRADDHTDKPKWYSLTMFPYPSGLLHVGHWYAFSIPDVFARLQRMRGYNVLYPMGFDSFGLPAENAAIKHSIHPSTWTDDNIPAMTTQFERMGVSIDWDRTVVTCRPDYYHWQQWLFLQMLKRGLAYKAGGSVWWCPNDQTVLANEQVIEGNICERCGAEVYKRNLEQWYFKITDYAEELLESIDDLDWPERVKTMQRNWIGRSEGARLEFTLETGGVLEVFTTRPDTVFGATFMVMAPEHPLVDVITTDDQRDAVETYVAKAKTKSDIERQGGEGNKEKTGVFSGAYAVNPVNDQRIPVWIADYVLTGYGTGAIMAVPSGDQRDFEFARQFDLPIVPTVQPGGAEPLDGATMTEAYTGSGTIVNSGPFDGMAQDDALPKMTTWLEEQGRGKAETTWRLRDWLISRQRYWGCPIPVVYCDSCGIVPVPEDQLPVELPLDAEFTPTGQSPLVSHEAFLHTTCPTCGGPARRETDTMDTFVDSSWYWYRYTSPDCATAPFDRTAADYWTPVDLYCGGIEHAILHLLYARFFTKALRDMGLVDQSEPFTRLRNQGMILSEEGVKMSKSRGTQVDPDALVDRHGADALRLHLMFLGPWELGGPWNDRGIVGMERFLRRAFQIVSEVGEQDLGGSAPDADVRSLVALTHKTIRKVTEDIDGFQFNTMIAALIEFTNDLMKLRDSAVAKTAEWRVAAETLTLLLAPGAPYIAEELWSRLGNEFSVHQQPWPTFDEALTKDETVEIPVQINGKVRDKIAVSVDASQDDMIAAAKSAPKIADSIAGKTIVKEIAVPGRMVNIVVRP